MKVKETNISCLTVFCIAITYSYGICLHAVDSDCGSVSFGVLVVKKCLKKRYREIHVEESCKSRRPVKNAVCRGTCGNQCCQPVKVKRRKIKIECQDDTWRTITLNIVRKCDCKEQCNNNVNVLVV